MIDLSKATLITGDFNVCLIQNPSNNITTTLKGLGFKQLIDKATHILGITLNLRMVFGSNSHSVPVSLCKQSLRILLSALFHQTVGAYNTVSSYLLFQVVILIMRTGETLLI